MLSPLYFVKGKQDHPIILLLSLVTLDPNIREKTYIILPYFANFVCSSTSFRRKLLTAVLED
jgi:hypothetical protein